jgi:DNA-binding response OmpR family regulator
MQLIEKLNSMIDQFHADRRGRNGPPTVLQERRTKPRLNARAGTRVLVIDDSARALAEMSKLFFHLNYVVSKTQDPERGLFMACFENPDLVILDVGMPGMNGFEVIKKMRRDPLARRIPVIMISGNPRSVDSFRRQRIDADGFIRKPFTRQDMFTKIESLLDHEGIPRRAEDVRLTRPTSLFTRIGRRLIHE